MPGNEVAGIWGELGADVNPLLRAVSKGVQALGVFGKALQKTQRGLGTLGKAVAKTGAAVESTGRAIGNVGRKVRNTGAVITATMTGIIVTTTKMAATFEERFAEIETLLGGVSSVQIAGMRKDILALSADFGKSTNEMALGLYATVSAGVDAAESIEFLAKATKAAIGGVASTNEAVLLGTGVIKAYGLQWKDATRVFDLAFQTVKLGQTTFAELAHSVGRVTPIAKAANIQLEEMFGAFATLTGVTGDTAEVATQLRAILNAVVGQSKEATEAAAALGLEFNAAALGSKGLGKFLKELADFMKDDAAIAARMNKMMKGTGKISKETGEQILLLNDLLGKTFLERMAVLIPNQRAIAAALALSNEQAATFAKKTKEMNKAAGSSEAAFKKMSSTFLFGFRQMVQQMKVFGIQIGEIFLPHMTKLVNAIKKVVIRMRDWVKANREAIDTEIWRFVTLWTTRLNIFLRLLKTHIIPVLKEWAEKIGWVKLSLLAILGPIMLLAGLALTIAAPFIVAFGKIIVVVGGLISKLWLLAPIFLVIGKIIADAWKEVSGSTLTFQDVIKGVVDTFLLVRKKIKDAVQFIADWIFKQWLRVKHRVIPIIKDLVKQAASAWAWLEGRTKEVWAAISLWLNTTGMDIWNTVSEWFQKIADFVISTSVWWFNAMKPKWLAILALAKQVWSSVWTIIQKFSRVIGEHIREVWTGLSEFWAENGDDILEVLSMFWEAAKRGFEQMQRNIATAIHWIISVWRLIEPAVMFIIDIMLSLWRHTMRIWRAIARVIGDAMMIVVSIIRGDWQKVGRFIIDFLVSLMSLFRKMFFPKELIADIMRATVRFIIDGWKRIFEFVGMILQKLWNLVWNTLKKMANTIWTLIFPHKIIASALLKGFNLIKGMWDRILNYTNKIWSKVRDKVTNTLMFWKKGSPRVTDVLGKSLTMIGDQLSAFQETVDISATRTFTTEAALAGAGAAGAEAGGPSTVNINIKQPVDRSVVRNAIIPEVTTAGRRGRTQLGREG